MRFRDHMRSRLSKYRAYRYSVYFFTFCIWVPILFLLTLLLSWVLAIKESTIETFGSLRYEYRVAKHVIKCEREGRLND